MITPVQIAIFGVGLIGGSLALCFKGKPGIRVIGHSPRETSLVKYMDYKVVDYATSSIEEAVRDADFIFLCVPVGLLDQYLTEIYKVPLKPGCIITDVGSTKRTIMETASLHQSADVFFIGGHPMAGSERSGVEAATANLFENAFYVLTPAQSSENQSTPESESAAYERLTELLKYTKANIVQMDAALHDEIVGAISHLPHMIAVALVNQISQYNEGNGFYKMLAAGGFRDLTRIAASDPIIWRDILLNNREVLLQLIADWNEQMHVFARMIEDCDGDGIQQAFTSSGQFRNQIPERRKGMIFSSFEVYVDVPDHPGILGQITTMHGEHHINIRNIQIMESRSDVPGVLRLSYRSELDMDRAVKLLRQQGYNVNFI
jgi:prephenate dehydrogenase